MVESGFVHPHVYALLHQFVNVVEHAVGCQGDVAVGGYHNLNLHPSLGGVLQGFLQLVVERQVGVDELDAVLSEVDGVGVELADNLVAGARFAVDDAHHFVLSRLSGVGTKVVEILGCAEASIIFLAVNVLSSLLVPNFQEDALQRVHFLSLDAAMHVAPRAHLLGSVDVVVGNVHASRVGYFSVNDHYFPMVASKNVVYPREVQRVELYNLDALFVQFLHVVALQGLVVRGISKSVVECSDFHTLFRFLCQQVEQSACNGIVAEVEVFQMNAAPRLADGLEHVVELLLTTRQKHHRVVVRECDVALPHFTCYQRIRSLALG